MRLKDPYKIILYPLQTEKGVRLREAEGKLIFIVDPKANKKMIKRSIEQLFSVKVKNINVMINLKGEKKAYVHFEDIVKANDLATQLGQV